MPDIPEVEVAEAQQRIAAGAALLDVREAHEWEAGHADAAQWIPMGEVAARRAELPDGHEIVVICRSGARSGKVTQALIRAGYDAVNLAGGMRAWEAAGHPVVTGAGTPGSVA